MILAIDPGFSNYGFVIYNKTGSIEKVGLIQTKKTKRKISRVSDDFANRCASITLQLNQIIQTYKIQAVLGEMPALGGQNASAVRDMATSVGISMSVFTSNHLPIEWCTAEEVKIALTGNKTATKLDMMLAASKNYSWKITTKDIFNKDKTLKRTDNIYWPQGEKMGASRFEHIADAVGVAHALRNGNIIKMYMKPKGN